MLRSRSSSAAALVTLTLVGSAGTARLPPLPASWPHTLQIGVADANRVQWLLGPGSGARLRACAAAGFAGLMFGRGADGATCACDAAKDGVTNPAPIDGTTRPSSSADDDGGYFKMQARAYYKAGALALPEG
ncbi:MAG: hypothetical protein QOH95_790 [Gaiellaceae bacterium]|nr:hypothetical protein [Gaiellaceae bacterium]